MTLNPAVFPFAPDGMSSITLTESLLTDVMVASKGVEVRHAMREVPVRTLVYSITLVQSDDLARFLGSWFSNDEPLLFTVPLWCEAFKPSSLSPTTVVLDRDVIDEFEVGDVVIAWQSDHVWQLVTVEDITGDSVDISDDLTGTMDVGPLRIIPVMLGWINPPVIDQQSVKAEKLTLTFYEELPNIAGADPDVGSAVSAIPASIQAVAFVEQVYPPFDVIALVKVLDADGMEIQNVEVEWESSISTTTVTPSPNTHEAVIYHDWGAGTVTAQAGSVSVLVAGFII